MQRFKKYAMAKGNVDAHHQPVIFGARYGFGLVPGADQTTGKFIYTLGTAGIYRAAVVAEMHRYPGEPVETYKAHLVHLRRLMNSARRHGFHLPA